MSKQTVYKHFVDKERLFTAIITGDIAETEALTQSLVDALPQTRDLERDLRPEGTLVDAERSGGVLSFCRSGSKRRTDE